MAAQNIIELGFNVDELAAEKKQVLELFVDMFGQLQKYDGTKFNPLGGGGLADLKKSLSEGAAAMNEFKESASKYNQVVTDQYQKQQQGKKTTDELTLAIKEYQKIVDQTAQTQARNNALGSNAAENLSIEKELLKQRNAELLAGVKYLVSETGSVNEARAAIKQMIIERDKLNAGDAEQKKRIDELNEAIDRNNAFINANTSKIEQQKNNVGNYIGAINILKPALDEISKKIAAMAAAGETSSEAFQNLVLEQKLLQQFLDKQGEGFANLNQELRATKNILDALALAGLENTEVFENLNTAYTTAKQKVNELHNEQKLLTSETPAISALTAAARGLGGAYALGAGASALFAQGNEKVEKELNKLVAIMTLLQGLEEAVKAIKDRGAIATALQATATKALIAVKQIEAKLFGTTAVAAEAEAAAKTINTEANVANAEAVAADTAAKETNIAATEGVVVADEAATAATFTLRTALISTGIGAIIIGLIYGITKLVSTISDWINAADHAEEVQKELTATTGELLATIKELDQAYRILGKERIEAMEREADLQRSAGKNQFIQLEDERKINEARLEMAKKYVSQKKIDQQVVDQLLQKQIVALEIVAGYEESLRQAQKAFAEDDSSANEDRVDRLKKVVEQQKADAKNVTTAYETARDALKEVTDSEKALNDTRVKTSKAAFDQLLQLRADAAQREYDVAKDAADRLANLPAATAEDKFNALKASYDAEVALERSKERALKDQLDRGIITQQEYNSGIDDLQTELNIKFKKYLQDHERLRIEYNDRELAARNEIAKNANESDIAIQEAITKDVQQELEKRLTALKQSIDDKTAIIQEDYDLQLKLAKQTGKTQTEIEAIEEERQKELTALTASTQKEIYDIVTSFGERRLKAIQDLNRAENAVNPVSANYGKEVSALNKSLADRTISYTRYLIERKKLDDQYDIERAHAQVEEDKAALKRLQDFEDDELEIRINAANAKLEAAKVTGEASEIEKAQSEADALKAIKIKTDGEIAAANKKLNEDEVKESEAKNKKILAAEKELHDQKKKLAEATFDLAKTLVDASYENQSNKIQEEIDLKNEQANAEIEAINRSSLSTQEKAQETIIVQARQKAQETQLKKQQKDEKIKEAKFDREAAVAKVIWDTAAAAMGAIKTYAGSPIGFAIAATIAALGAVEVATILAKPIPTYGEGIGIPGKGEHGGGLAWVGELYKPEKVSIPGQKPFIVSEPTLIDLPAKSSVLPIDLDNVVYDLGWQALLQGNAYAGSVDSGNKNVEDAIRVQTQQLTRAYKKSQRRIQNTIIIQSDTDYNSWVEKKIIGRR